MKNWYTPLKAALLCIVVAVILLVGLRVYFLMDTTETFLRHRDVEVAVVADNLNATIRSANDTVQSLNGTIQNINGTVGEARALIKTQGEYQKAQNDKINDVLEQTETALINAQRNFEDIDDTVTKLGDSVTTQVNHVGPLVEATTTAVNEAATTLAGPAVQGTLQHIDTTTANIASTTGHIDHVAGIFAKKVDDNMKPQPWWRKMGSFIYKAVILTSSAKDLVK